MSIMGAKVQCWPSAEASAAAMAAPFSTSAGSKDEARARGMGSMVR